MVPSGNNMGPPKYYHQVERDPENIKSIWKVLHGVTFLLIIFNSLISAYMFGDILKMFNYRCILHVKPTFTLAEVIYNTNDSRTDDELTYIKEDNTKIIMDVAPTTNTSETNVDWANAINISQHVYIIDEKFWYKNDSEYGKVDVHIRGSDYGTTTSCDLVLFSPLLSLIAAAAFGALILLFGRGQESQKSWIIVYPILIASAIMTILSIISMVSIKNGIEDFCSHFQDYTGQVQCSHLMSHFTFQGKWTIRDFWGDYMICFYSYVAALLLWIIELVVTILRLASLADFYFITLSVERTQPNDNEEVDEKIHNALIKRGLKPIINKFSSDDDRNNSTIEKDEYTTVV